MSNTHPVDTALASRTNDFIKANPLASRFEIASAMGVSREKLARLARLGHLDHWPRPKSRSEAARIGRKKGNTWGDKFFLRGSPLMGGKKK